MVEIDGKDEAILEVLKGDSSLSMQKIAKRTGIPIATVHHRIKRLVGEGVIERYTVIIDKERLGKRLVAYILVKATPRSDHVELLEKLMKHESIEDGSAITGAFDLMLKVRLASIEELDRFVLKHLRTFDDIAQTETMIAFRNIVRW